MATNEPQDDFIHQLAIKLSRATNSLNPSDVFAKTVIELAKSNPPDAFVNCELFVRLVQVPLLIVETVAKSFGSFQENFLIQVHEDILAHERQTKSGHVPQPVVGMNIMDSDVLEPEPMRKGGLIRPEKVCQLPLQNMVKADRTFQQHTFRAPAKPVEPPTPRGSLLGLQRLALEKRAAAAEEGSRKKARTDDVPPSFKGMSGQSPV